MIVSKKEFIENKFRYINEINSGKIFIYPTDTIYGIGCNALNDNAVKKIRQIKKRQSQPFSVIAPSKDWITNNCECDDKLLSRLPGPYTLILKLINKNSVSEFVNPKIENLGVRIPNNWFSKIINEANIPIISTSVNIAGEQNMTSIEDLNENIKNKVDYIIYEGPKIGKASIIIGIDGERIR